MIHLVRTLPIVVLLAALTVGASQGGMGHGPGHGPAGGAAMMGPGTMGPGTMGPGTMGPGMMGPGMAGAGMHGMPTATTDVLSFLQHMIPHHREAIASAEALRAVTERAELRALLQDVIETQSAEVELMHGWINAWFPDAEPEAHVEPMMRDLGAAPVADLERAWLEDMIMHHMMAVHEARALLGLDLSDHPEVAELANAIVADQMSEMRQMAGWLSAWFGVDPMAAMHGGAGTGAMHGMGAGHGMGATDGMGGLHGMGAMDRAGMGQVDGMHGMGPMHRMHGMGQMDGMHGMGPMHRMHGMGGMRGAMGDRHGGTAAGAFSADVVEALARAYLAGRGGDVETLDVGAMRVTYEVTYRAGGVDGVLLVDALTGDVVDETGR
jgi:uncharacterized protein (DUF305 family)